MPVFPCRLPVFYMLMGIHLQVTGNKASGAGAGNGAGGGIFAVGVFTMTNTEVAMITQGVTFKMSDQITEVRKSVWASVKRKRGKVKISKICFKSCKL